MNLPSQRTVIGGRYVLLSAIGEGGMGTIWRARDQTLDRDVALKLLFPRDGRDHQVMVRRFLREARTAAAVQHRNVIQIADFGTTEAGQPYMVMELLDGEPLGDRLRRTPPLEATTFIQIAGMTLRGLSAVHRAGIVHRDLKPDNIFLIQQDGAAFPKILDFGISRSVEPRQERQTGLTTREGVIVGTPEYMSPEQARGVRAIDHRSDIYSMGVILYEGLTGRLPHESENVGDLIIKIVTTRAPRVDSINEAVPGRLADVVARAMSPSPADRFPTAREMREALTRAADAADLTPDVPPLSERPSRVRSADGALAARSATASSQDEFEFSLEEVQPALAPVPSPPPPPPPPPLVPSPPPAVVAAARGGSAQRHQRSRTATLSLVAALAGTAAATVWLQSATEDLPATDERVAMRGLSEDVSQAVAEPVAEAALAEVTLSLDGVPEGATITIDGTAAQPPLRFARDGARHSVVVEHPSRGLRWRTVFTAERDVSRTVRLAATGSSGSAKLGAADRGSNDGTTAPAKRQRPRRAPARTGTRRGKSSKSSKSSKSGNRRATPPAALKKLDF